MLVDGDYNLILDTLSVRCFGIFRQRYLESLCIYELRTKNVSD